jgi:hypothetical protein
VEEIIRYVTLAFSLIQERRAAGFPVAREVMSLVGFIMNPPKEITPEMWLEHDAAQEAARAARKAAQPKE